MPHLCRRRALTALWIVFGLGVCASHLSAGSSEHRQAFDVVADPSGQYKDPFASVEPPEVWTQFLRRVMAQRGAVRIHFVCLRVWSDPTSDRLTTGRVNSSVAVVDPETHEILYLGHGLGKTPFSVFATGGHDEIAMARANKAAVHQMLEKAPALVGLDQEHKLWPALPAYAPKTAVGGRRAPARDRDAAPTPPRKPAPRSAPAAPNRPQAAERPSEAQAPPLTARQRAEKLREARQWMRQLRSSDASDAAKADAAEALGALGAEAARYAAPLRQLLNHPRESMTVKRGAAKALARLMPHAPLAERAMGDLYVDPRADAEMRAVAAEAIAEHGGEQLPWAKIARQAAETLSADMSQDELAQTLALLHHSGEGAKLAAKPLSRMLAAPKLHGNRRHALLKALGEFAPHDRSAAEALLEALAQPANGRSRAMILSVLAAVDPQKTPWYDQVPWSNHLKTITATQTINERRPATLLIERMGPGALAAVDTLTAWAIDSPETGAGRVLQNLGPATVAPMLAMLESDKHRHQRRFILDHLAAMGAGAETAVPYFRRRLESDKQHERQEAAAMLAKLGPSGAEALRSAAGTGRASAEALPQLIKHSDDRSKLLEPLLQAIRTGNNRARRQAIRHLTTFGPDAAPAIDALAEVLKGSRHSDTVVEAAIALVRIGPASKPVLEPVFQSVGNEVSQTAVAAAGRLEPSDRWILPMIRPWEKHPETRKYAAAAYVALQSDLEKAVSIYEQELIDKSRQTGLDWLAYDALRKLIAIGPPAAAATDTVIDRALASLHIENHLYFTDRFFDATAADRPKLMTAWAKHLRSKDAGIRQRAAMHLRRHGPQAAPAAEALAEALGDEDFFVARHAMWALVEIGQPAAPSLRAALKSDQPLARLHARHALTALEPKDER